MLPAIRVQNVSKCFQLGGSPVQANLSEGLRNVARSTARKIRGLLNPGEAATDNRYMAIQDVTFDVFPGEVVGLIGRNGAGKSTLLKVISRVTMPTGGRIELRGRLGSMLEVNTGFHPELTGRENIFLAGSILGMRRREILAKFDQIVAFSEIGQHLDTPVKRYSSGQYVRLAFAVTAHLEPEILIIDEVLAVGDATFQRKCIHRMAELARQGRTILFVTHNMQLIPQLCSRAVMLANSRVEAIGPAADVTQKYLDKLLTDSRAGDLRDRPRSGDGRALFVRAGVLDGEGRAISVFITETDMVVRMEVESNDRFPDVTLSVVVQSLHGTKVISTWTREAGFDVALDRGIQAFECRLRDVRLRPGQTVILNLWMATGNGTLLDSVENAIVIDVLGDDRHAHLSTSTDHGVVYCQHEWKRIPVGS
jgi:lipopolysaccharide transport system ATP-binding protein